MYNREDLVKKLEKKANKLALSFNKIAKNSIAPKNKALSKMRAVASALRDIKAGKPYHVQDGFLSTHSAKVKLTGE